MGDGRRETGDGNDCPPVADGDGGPSYRSLELAKEPVGPQDILGSFTPGEELVE